jgi:hypothetical protein
MVTATTVKNEGESIENEILQALQTYMPSHIRDRVTDLIDGQPSEAVLDMLLSMVRDNVCVSTCMEILMFHCGQLGRAKILDLLIEDPRYLSTDMLIRVDDPVFLECIIVIQAYHLLPHQTIPSYTSRRCHQLPLPFTRREYL